MDETKEMLASLCELSRVNLTGSEQEKFVEDFKKILEFIEKVKSMALPAQEKIPIVFQESMRLAEDQPAPFTFNEDFRRVYRVGNLLVD